jgi:predicted AAA+ superfamily ATPase
VRSYLDYLEGAFLVRLLPPFTPNLGKRLVRSPKLYWRDSGLLHAILGIASRDDLLVQPWVGASWEGYVIEQTISALTATGDRSEPYFFRTSDGRELDLVLDRGSERWAFEIKLTSQPDSRDLDRLQTVADLITARRRFLISQTRESTFSEEVSSANLPDLLAQLA